MGFVSVLLLARPRLIYQNKFDQVEYLKSGTDAQVRDQEAGLDESRSGEMSGMSTGVADSGELAGRVHALQALRSSFPNSIFVPRRHFFRSGGRRRSACCQDRNP
jgi:hypothetical protein